MNKLLLFLFVLIAPASFAQVTLKGVLKDITTQEPVEGATISAAGSNTATVSNSEGSFRIILPAGTAGISISHLSYKTYTLTLEVAAATTDIFLEPAGIELEEVVITSKPVKEILKDVISASKKHLEKSLLMNTYYREFAKLNDTYTKFADGLLDYNIKRKSGAADVYVKQSRSFRLVDTGTGFRDRMSDALNLFDVRDAVSDSYDFKWVKDLLADDKYTYELKMRTDKEGKSIEIVTIIPKPDIKEALYEGTVIYDSATKLIIDIDIKNAEAYKKYSKVLNYVLVKFIVLDEAHKTSFKIDGDKYILSYYKIRANIHIKMNGRLDDNFDYLSDMVTMDYKEGEFDLDRSRRYKEESLFAAGTHYTEEYWKTSNTLLLTQAEENIIKKLQ